MENKRMRKMPGVPAWFYHKLDFGFIQRVKNALAEHIVDNRL